MTPARLRLFAVTTTLALGLNWPIMSIGVSYVPPLWFAVIRLFGSGLLLAVILLLRSEFRIPEREDVPLVLSVSILRLAVNQGLIVVALTIVAAGRSAVLVYTSALWVALLSVWLLGESLSTRSWSAVGIGTTGIVLLTGPWAMTGARAPLGVALLLLSALSVALGAIHIRGHQWRGEQASLMAWQLLFAGIALMPAAYVLHGGPAFAIDGRVLLILGYQVVVASLLGFWGSLTLTRHLPAVTSAMISLATPVLGAFSASLFLGERLSLLELVGMALIGVGVILRTFDVTSGRRVRRPGEVASGQDAADSVGLPGPRDPL